MNLANPECRENCLSSGADYGFEKARWKTNPKAKLGYIEMIRPGMTPRKVAGEYRGLITPAAVSEAVSLVPRGLVREIEKKPAA